LKPIDLSYDRKALDRTVLKDIEKLSEPADKVTISAKPAKSGRQWKSAKTSKRSAESKAPAAHKAEKKTAAVAAFLHDDGDLSASRMPDYGSRRGSGPDDVDDDGACPGSGRRDNTDNPDHVTDNGGCGGGYDRGSDYNYSGPDGSYSYDEFH
jgi:hypothetical protein